MNDLTKYSTTELALRDLQKYLMIDNLPIEEPFPPIHTAWKTFASFRDVRTLAFGKDELWALTWGGVIRWRFGKSKTKFTRFASEHGLPGNRFECLAIDGEGRVWVGGRPKASRFTRPESGTRSNSKRNLRNMDEFEASFGTGIAKYSLDTKGA